MTEVIGIDRLYVTVRDLEVSRRYTENARPGHRSPTSG